MSGAHWPWWLGAAGLAAVTVGSCLVGRRPLGVSGILGRFVNWKEELAAERARAAMASADGAALEAAFLAATAEAFGSLAAQPAGSAAPAFQAPGAAAGSGPVPCAERCHPAERPSLGAHGVFLVSIVAGAFLASTLRGGFHPTLALPETYARVVASGGWGFVLLGVGGLLVGVGTSVSGGCSTGHGLSGCSRLQPASLAATATFFGVGVAVSFLLAGRLA